MAPVDIVALVLGFAGIGAGLLFILHDASIRWLDAPRRYDESYHVVTGDGWRIGVHRYFPRGMGARDERPRLPVILCHGLGANHFNLDYHDGLSVAQFLADRGYDCHLVDLRGRSDSIQPPEGRGRYDWSFDDYVQYDVPAVVDAVRERTGATEVLWLGHSMGGMIAYAWLEACALRGEEQPGIAALVTFASPVGARNMGYFRYEAKLNNYLWFLPAVHTRPVSVALAPLVGWVKTPGLKIIAQPGSFSGKMQRHGMVNAIAPISRAEIQQFADWILDGEFPNADRSRVYYRHLDRVRVPACFIAGTKDYMGRPENVRVAFERWGAEEKEFHLFGRATGSSVDFGHVDLVIGDRAPSEVWPVMEEFLARHAYGDAAPARRELPSVAEPSVA